METTQPSLRRYVLYIYFTLDYTNDFTVYVCYIKRQKRGRWVRYTILPNMLHTLNDVHDSRAKEISENGMASLNFTEPCHQVVRYVDRAVLIEPVDFQVIALFVRDALEAGFRSCDVLQSDNSRHFLVFNDQNWKMKHQELESTHSEACLMILQVDIPWVGLCCYLTMVGLSHFYPLAPILRHKKYFTTYNAILPSSKNCDQPEWLG